MIRNGATFDGTKWPDLAKANGSTTLPDDRGLFIRGYDPTSTNDIDGSSRALGSFQEGSIMVGGPGPYIAGITGLETDGTFAKGLQYVGWDILHDQSKTYRAVGIPSGILAVSTGGLTDTANGTGSNQVLGAARPKNRNYLPIIYAGPPVQ